MSRLFLQFISPLLTVFTAAVLLIRAQPIEEQDLRAFLISPGCAPPCFLGIRPGVTTVGEAIAILENHAWVEHVQPYYIGPDATSSESRGWAYWDWKESASIWYRASPDALRGHAGMFEMEHGVVADISIATNIPFGSVRLMMGKPSGYGLSFSDVIIKQGIFDSANLHYQDAYLGDNIQTEAVSLCKNVWNLWFEPSTITFFENQQISRRTETFVGNRPFLSEVHTLQKKVCPGVR
jgi:hypothetical protein